MTVKELIAELSKYPPDEEVFVDCNNEYYHCTTDAVVAHKKAMCFGDYLAIIS